MVKVSTNSVAIDILNNEKVYDLLHFRRALAEERYEVCGFWAGQARKSGATMTEIRASIRLALSGAAFSN